MKIAAILLLVAAIFLSIPARTPSIEIARKFWRQEPQCGHVVNFLRRDLGRTPLGEVGGAADVDHCIIYLDTRDFPKPVRCAIIVHEYGHLVGREHVDNPRSIMYPKVDARNIPRVCK